jgi:hypothetical protein
MEAFQPLNLSDGYKRCGEVWQVPQQEDCPITNFDINKTAGSPIEKTGDYLHIQRLTDD